jgi:DNA-binding NtrC family response regulator
MKPLVFIISNTKPECESIAELINDKYATMSSINKSDVISLYRMAANTIKLVLLDLDFDKGTGFELLEELRTISSMPEFVVLTTKNSPEIAIKAMKLGAYDILHKSVLNEQLVRSLNKIHSYADVLQRMVKNFSNAFYKNIEFRLLEIKQLLEEKQKKNKKISDEEILAFFKEDEINEGLSATNIKQILQIDKTNEDKSFAKVLIVEDEDEMRDSLTEILLRDYDVIQASDGEKAIEVINKHHNIDVILLDIGLPGKKGTEWMATFKELLPNVEIIMLTAFGEKEFIIDSFHHAAFDYITKPFKANNLFLTINRALQKIHFENIISDIGQKKLIENIPENKKTLILNNIAKQRAEDNMQLLMSDIYLFYPELKECGLAPDYKIPTDVAEDGVLFFIEDLKSKI